MNPMVGISGKNRWNKVFYYYVCNGKRLQKICDKKKDQCICCHRFFSRPEIEIDPKDLAIDRPKKIPKKYAEVSA